jgi:short-subunit dehydrogenase
MKFRLKPLSEQVVVIVGASSGIGLSTARLAAARGARVVVVARSRNALDQLVSEIRERGGQAIAVVADATSEDSIRQVAIEAERAFGRIDTWINNAAVSAYGRCLEVTLDDMRQIMETNFWGVVYGSRIACAHLNTRGGALINLGSVVGDHAAPLQGIYSASKHAISGFTEALRMELLHDAAPISVTLIKPSAINTPYAERAKNYLEDQPTHAPPVYAPRSVAKAILYAAEHPVRELVVGSSGKLLALADFVAPGLVDRLMASLLIPATHSGRPRRGRPAMDGPSEDLRETGDYQGVVRGSIYTSIVTHRRAAVVVFATAAFALGWRRRSAVNTTARRRRIEATPALTASRSDLERRGQRDTKDPLQHRARRPVAAHAVHASAGRGRAGTEK